MSLFVKRLVGLSCVIHCWLLYNITFNFNMQCFWSEPLSNDFTVAWVISCVYQFISDSQRYQLLSTSGHLVVYAVVMPCCTLRALYLILSCLDLLKCSLKWQHETSSNHMSFLWFKTKVIIKCYSKGTSLCSSWNFCIHSNWNRPLVGYNVVWLILSIQYFLKCLDMKVF